MKITKFLWYAFLIFLAFEAVASIYAVYYVKPDWKIIQYLTNVSNKINDTETPDSILIYNKTKNRNTLHLKFRYPFTNNPFKEWLYSITPVGDIKTARLIRYLDSTDNISCLKDGTSYVICNINLKSR